MKIKFDKVFIDNAIETVKRKNIGVIYIFGGFGKVWKNDYLQGKTIRYLNTLRK